MLRIGISHGVHFVSEQVMVIVAPSSFIPMKKRTDANYFIPFSFARRFSLGNFHPSIEPFDLTSSSGSVLFVNCQASGAAGHVHLPCPCALYCVAAAHVTHVRHVRGGPLRNGGVAQRGKGQNQDSALALSPPASGRKKPEVRIYLDKLGFPMADPQAPFSLRRFFRCN